MKNLSVFISLIAILFAACGESSRNDQKAPGEANLSSSRSQEIAKDSDAGENILIIVGEGGTSGGMFSKASKTYQKTYGGELYEVKNGDEFIHAIRDFTKKKGKIKHLEYFGHGNSVGLFVNQTPHVNGGLYANDPAQNEAYLAASLYELNENSFQKNGSIQFNGCNVAAGYPVSDSLAQRFANYFNIKVTAPVGPTEFSSKKDGVSPPFADEIFMVPSNAKRGFVVVSPQPSGESRFSDVRKGASYEKAVATLDQRGLNLNFQDNTFLPYKNVTYGEAREFCKIAISDSQRCAVAGLVPESNIRNLKALKMLVDAYAIKIVPTSPWHKGYIWWAENNHLLTKDFTTKKWYTRGEMAELTFHFMEKLKN